MLVVRLLKVQRQPDEEIIHAVVRKQERSSCLRVFIKLSAWALSCGLPGRDIRAAQARERLAVAPGRVLRSTIRVMDAPRRGMARLDRRIQRGERQPRIEQRPELIAHRPCGTTRPE